MKPKLSAQVIIYLTLSGPGFFGRRVRAYRKHFYQDNQSAIQLEKNGRASCGQKSRHIDIRYFFMQDRFESEGISVVYCPTDEMLANFFTKPIKWAPVTVHSF